MNRTKLLAFTVWFLVLTSCAAPTTKIDSVPEAFVDNSREWPGRIMYICDASAALVRSDGSFLIASDETNVLTEYDRAGTKIGPHEPSLDRLIKKAEMDLDPDEELDIEGVALHQTENREIAYWIGSHARRKVRWKKNGDVKKAKLRKNSRVLFATNVPQTGSLVSLEGKPVVNLVDTLLSPPSSLEEMLKPLSKAEKLWADAGGWNIEGLSLGPDGSLLVGFRSPPNNNKQSLVVSITNPLKMIEGSSIELGNATWLDLGKRGIRSMDWSPYLSAWLIVAGPIGYIDTKTKKDVPGYASDFAVYVWKGFGEPVINLNVDLSNLRPEILIATADGFYLISDDGSVERAGMSCKKRIKENPQDPEAYVRARFFRLNY